MGNASKSEIKRCYNSINKINNFSNFKHEKIWASVIKEETLEELAVRFVNYNYNNCKNSTVDNLMSFLTENKKTIHRLSK